MMYCRRRSIAYSARLPSNTETAIKRTVNEIKKLPITAKTPDKMLTKNWSFFNGIGAKNPMKKGRMAPIGIAITKYILTVDIV